MSPAENIKPDYARLRQTMYCRTRQKNDKLSQRLKSVFEGDQGNIYLTCGLQHFMNSGDIYLIRSDRTVSTIYKSSGPPRYKDRKTKELIDPGGLFIGPGGNSAQCDHLISRQSDHLQTRHLVV